MRRRQDQGPAPESSRVSMPPPDDAGADEAALDCPLRRELIELNGLGSGRFIEIGRRLRAFYEALPESRGKFKALTELLRGTGIVSRKCLAWASLRCDDWRGKAPGCAPTVTRSGGFRLLWRRRASSSYRRLTGSGRT